MNGIRLVTLIILAGVLPLGCAAPATSTTPSPPVTTTTSSPPVTTTSTTSSPPVTTTTSTPAATTTTTTTSSTPVPAAPGLAIVAPAPNAYLINADVTVTVTVTGFHLNGTAGQGNAPGEGHIIYYLDGKPPVTAGEPAFTTPGSYTVTGNTSCEWPGVITGGHTFWAQLVNNDDTPLDPPVTAKVVVTVYTD